jgi:hypothetical protein
MNQCVAFKILFPNQSCLLDFLYALWQILDSKLGILAPFWSTFRSPRRAKLTGVKNPVRKAVEGLENRPEAVPSPCFDAPKAVKDVDVNS